MLDANERESRSITLRGPSRGSPAPPAPPGTGGVAADGTLLSRQEKPAFPKKKDANHNTFGLDHSQQGIKQQPAEGRAVLLQAELLLSFQATRTAKLQIQKNN